jgi:hypothetical protein
MHPRCSIRAVALLGAFIAGCSEITPTTPNDTTERSPWRRKARSSRSR